MEIEKTLHLAAPPAQVWALLLDPQAMAACVPGMQSVEIVGPDEYTALMQVKIAFVSARFRLRTRIVQRDEPHYLKAEGTGEDAAVASSLKQTTEVFLEAAAEGGTGLRLKVHVDVLGRIGSFGLSAMKTKADRLWDEFGVKLAERLGPAVPVAGEAPSLPAIAGPAAEAAASAESEPRPAAEPGIAVRPAPGPGPEAAAPAGAFAPAAGQLAPPAQRTVTEPPRMPAPTPRTWGERLGQALGLRRPADECIVVEMRRPDQTWIRVEWPASRAAECAQWLRETTR